MDLFDHQLYSGPKGTSDAASMPFAMATAASPTARARKSKPRKAKKLVYTAPPSAESTEELVAPSAGRSRSLRDAPLESELADSFLGGSSLQPYNTGGFALAVPFDSELDILPEAETMDTKIFMQCANGELSAAMNSLRQMMQEGLEPSAAVISALVEAHAPTQLHTAFKLMAATLKMPADSMPNQPAVLTFLRQCEMQEVDREAIARVEDVLSGFKDRGYRMNADIKGAWQALKSMEMRKMQEASDKAERDKRANDAQQRALRRHAEQQAKQIADQRALQVAEQQARDEAALQAQVQAQKLQKLEDEKRAQEELERRARDNEALVLAMGHRERKAQLEMIRQSQEAAAQRVRQEAEMVLWETEQRAAAEYNARQAKEEAKQKEAERAAREEAEARASRLEQKLAEAQQTLTSISREAKEQQMRENFEATIFFACSNGDLDLSAGTLQEMISQKVNPSAEALGGVVELHIKSALNTAFNLLELSLDMPPTSMAPRSVVLSFLRECERQHVDEAALTRAEEIIGAMEERGAIVVDDTLTNTLKSARMWHAAQRERQRLEEEAAANKMAREQMELRVQAEIDRRAQDAERMAREAGEAKAAAELELRTKKLAIEQQKQDAAREAQLKAELLKFEQTAREAADRKWQQQAERFMKMEAERKERESAQQQKTEQERAAAIKLLEERAEQQAAQLAKEMDARSAAAVRVEEMEKRMVETEIRAQENAAKMLSMHQEAQKAAAAEQVAATQALEKELSVAVQRARSDTQSKMKVAIDEERAARELAEEQARVHKAEHDAKHEQMQHITEQSARMAKEAAEFEARHAVEEAERRTKAREEAEAWARDQVAAERQARAEAERKAQVHAERLSKQVRELEAHKSAVAEADSKREEVRQAEEQAAQERHAESRRKTEEMEQKLLEGSWAGIQVAAKVRQSVLDQTTEVADKPAVSEMRMSELLQPKAKLETATLPPEGKLSKGAQEEGHAPAPASVQAPSFDSEHQPEPETLAPAEVTAGRPEVASKSNEQENQVDAAERTRELEHILLGHEEEPVPAQESVQMASSDSENQSDSAAAELAARSPTESDLTDRQRTAELERILLQDGEPGAEVTVDMPSAYDSWLASPPVPPSSIVNQPHDSISELHPEPEPEAQLSVQAEVSPSAPHAPAADLEATRLQQEHAKELERVRRENEELKQLAQQRSDELAAQKAAEEMRAMQEQVAQLRAVKPPEPESQPAEESRAPEDLFAEPPSAAGSLARHAEIGTQLEELSARAAQAKADAERQAQKDAEAAAERARAEQAAEAAETNKQFDRDIQLACAHTELQEAMKLLQQMMQAGFQPAAKTMGDLIVGHAPVNIEKAFKLLRHCLELPDDSMPPKQSVVLFLQQCREQSMDEDVIVSIQDVLTRLHARGYELSPQMKTEFRALRSEAEDRRKHEADLYRLRAEVHNLRSESTPMSASQGSAAQKSDETATQLLGQFAANKNAALGSIESTTDIAALPKWKQMLAQKAQEAQATAPLSPPEPQSDSAPAPAPEPAPEQAPEQAPEPEPEPARRKPRLSFSASEAEVRSYEESAESRRAKQEAAAPALKAADDIIASRNSSTPAVVPSGPTEEELEAERLEMEAMQAALNDALGKPTTTTASDPASFAADQLSEVSPPNAKKSGPPPIAKKKPSPPAVVSQDSERDAAPAVPPSIPKKTATPPSIPQQAAAPPSIPKKTATLPSIPQQAAASSSIPKTVATPPSIPKKAAIPPSIPKKAAAPPIIPKSSVATPTPAPVSARSSTSRPAMALGKHVVLLKSVIRAGFALDSEKVGVLKKDSVIDVLELRVHDTGTRRIRYADGWVSMMLSDGRVVLEPVLDKSHGNASFSAAQQQYANDWSAERATKPLTDWSADAVGDWIHRSPELQLSQYVTDFLENDIDGSTLVELLPPTSANSETWAQLGVSTAHRRLICKQVRQLVPHAPNGSDSGDDDSGNDGGDDNNGNAPVSNASDGATLGSEQTHRPAVVQQYSAERAAAPSATTVNTTTSTGGEDNPAAVQDMMNAAKNDVVLGTLQRNGGSCTFQTIMDYAEQVHCDVTSAALLSLKRAKKVSYDGMMLLLPTHANVIVTVAGGAVQPAPSASKSSGPPPVVAQKRVPEPAPAPVVPASLPAAQRKPRKVVAQWAKNYDGPLGLRFEDDLSIGAMSPNALSGQPQLETGMVLISVNGKAVEGLTKGAAIATIQAAGKPLTLVFLSGGTAAADSSTIENTTSSAATLPADWESWRPYQLKAELQRLDLPCDGERAQLQQTMRDYASGKIKPGEHAQKKEESAGAQYKVLRDCVLRAGLEMDSPKGGVLKTGEVITVYERVVNAQGTTRVRSAKGWTSEWTSGGLQTMKLEAGETAPSAVGLPGVPAELVRAAANGPAKPAQHPPQDAPAGISNSVSPSLQRLRDQQAIEDAERLLEQLSDVDDVSEDLSAAEYDELQADALAQFETLRVQLGAVKQMDTELMVKLDNAVAAVKAESKRKRQAEDDKAHGRTGAQATAAPAPVRPLRKASAGREAARAVLMGDDEDAELFDTASGATTKTLEEEDDGLTKTPSSFGVLPRHHMTAQQGNLASEAAKKKAERLRRQDEAAEAAQAAEEARLAEETAAKTRAAEARARRTERRAAERREEEELAAVEEKAKATALFAKREAKTVTNPSNENQADVDGQDDDSDGDDKEKVLDDEQEEPVMSTRKAPPRRSKAVFAAAPVPQQSPAPPRLRPKITGPGEETSLPTPSALDGVAEQTAVGHNATTSKKVDTTASTSAPTKYKVVEKHGALVRQDFDAKSGRVGMLKRGEVVVALESKKQGPGQRIYIDGPRLTGWLNTKANDGAPILLPVREKVATSAEDKEEEDKATKAGGKPGSSKGGLFGGGGGGGVFGRGGTTTAVQAAAKLRRGGSAAGRGRGRGRARGRGNKQEFTIKVSKWPRGRVKMMYRGLLNNMKISRSYEVSSEQVGSLSKGEVIEAVETRGPDEKGVTRVKFKRPGSDMFAWISTQKDDGTKLLDSWMTQ